MPRAAHPTASRHGQAWQRALAAALEAKADELAAALTVPGDVVEAVLADALQRAAAVGQWAVVEQVARELERVGGAARASCNWTWNAPGVGGRDASLAAGCAATVASHVRSPAGRVGSRPPLVPDRIVVMPIPTLARAVGHWKPCGLDAHIRMRFSALSLVTKFPRHLLCHQAPD